MLNVFKISASKHTLILLEDCSTIIIAILFIKKIIYNNLEFNILFHIIFSLKDKKLTQFQWKYMNCLYYYFFPISTF